MYQTFPYPVNCHVFFLILPDNRESTNMFHFCLQHFFCRLGNTNRALPRRPVIHVSPARPVVERQGARPVVHVSLDRRLWWMARRGVFLANEDSIVRQWHGPNKKAGELKKMTYQDICKENDPLLGNPSKLDGLWWFKTLNTWIHQHVVHPVQFESNYTNWNC